MSRGGAEAQSRGQPTGNRSRASLFEFVGWGISAFDLSQVISAKRVGESARHFPRGTAGKWVDVWEVSFRGVICQLSVINQQHAGAAAIGAACDLMYRCAWRGDYLAGSARKRSARSEGANSRSGEGYVLLLRFPRGRAAILMILSFSMT